MRYLSFCVAGIFTVTGCGNMPAEMVSTSNVTPKLSITSVPDNVLNCKGNAPECKVTVRIEVNADGSCKAIVDPHEVRIKKDTPVNFLLVRSTMTDSNTYSYIGQGISWTGTAPSSDQLTFNQLNADGTVAQWTTGKTKTPKDLGFVPLVKRTSDNMLCGAGDPVIANDG